MLVRVFFTFALLLALWNPVQASSIVLDDSSATTHLPVGPNFSFLVPIPMGGTSSMGFHATIAFNGLDLFFAAPPAATDISFCFSTFFALCTISENSGTTDVHFGQGTDSGIPAGVDFNLKLTGFVTGQQINGVDNAPEPATFWPVGLPILAAFAVTGWRRARNHSTCGKPLSDAAC